MNKASFLCGVFLFFCVFSVDVHAAEIDKNTARMQAMDKITGKVSVIKVPVGGAVDFGSFSIVVRSCKTRPVEEAPENFAFVDITDKTKDGDEVNIFKGWMISSSPATNAVEHPIYDVWLLKCLDTEVKSEQLLTAQQLEVRDSLPMQRLTANDSVADANTESTVADNNKKQLSPMSEMIYSADKSSDNEEDKKEKSSPQTQSEQEFSFDEETEEDNQEIQSELNRIKSDMLTNIDGALSKE